MQEANNVLFNQAKSNLSNSLWTFAISSPRCALSSAFLSTHSEGRAEGICEAL